MKRKKHKKDVFIPKNMTKYISKHLPVVRSSWERKFMQYLDSNLSILEWSSESIAIPYFDPVQGKPRRYYPDFYVLIRKGRKLQELIIEIKPHKETIPPRRNKKSGKTRLYEQKTYKTNIAKWKAAQNWCDKMNMKFITLTEKQLFGKG